MQLPVYTAEGGGLFWLMVIIMIGGQISKLLNKGGKALPKDAPPSTGPDIEEFLRKLAQGENPLEELATKPPPPPPQHPPQAKRQQPPAAVKRETERPQPVTRATPPARTKKMPPPPVPRRHPAMTAQAAPPPPPRRVPHANTRIERKPIQVAARTSGTPGIRFRGIKRMLRQQDSLKSAILLREILGPPTSAIRR